MKTKMVELETSVGYVERIEITYYRGRYAFTWQEEMPDPSRAVRVVFTEYGVKHFVRMVRIAKQLREHHNCGYELVMLPRDEAEVTEYPADASDVMPDAHDLGCLVDWIEADGGRMLMEVLRALKRADRSAD